MERLGVYLLLVLIIYCVTFTSASRTCLQSRLEHYPCTYRHPGSTDKPGNNQVGQYFTSFKNRWCEIRRRGHRVQNIPKVSAGEGSVFYLYSPGKNYQIPRSYYNRNLVFYNVNCSAGQYIYFKVHEMNLENSKCYDATVGRSRCIDYIQVNTAEGYTIADNCGTDTSNLNRKVFPFDSIQVIFRSNRKRAFAGFYATALCFSPARQSPAVAPNCFKSRPVRPDPITASECQFQATSHEEIRIPYGHEVLISATAQSTFISLINNRNNQVTRRLTRSSISTLTVQFMDGSIQIYGNNYIQTPTRPSPPIRSTLRKPTGRPIRLEYFRDSRMSRRSPRPLYIPRIPTTLQEPGVLYIPRSVVSSRACFENYLVDVSSYKPSGKEEQIIQSLTRAMENLIDRDEPLDEPQADDEQVEVATSKPTVNSGRTEILQRCGRHFCKLQRYKRSSTGRRTDLIDQNSLFSAVQNDKSCNPILRTTSNAIVRALNRENPTVLTSMRQRALEQTQSFS